MREVPTCRILPFMHKKRPPAVSTGGRPKMLSRFPELNLRSVDKDSIPHNLRMRSLALHIEHFKTTFRGLRNAQALPCRSSSRGNVPVDGSGRGV